MQSTTPNQGFAVWWQLTRPHTLTAAFVPVSIGTVLAAKETVLNYGLFAAMLFACLLIQAATNMFNEYFDFKRGLDNEQSVGIGGTIVRDGIAPKTVLQLAFSFFGLATLLGIYICMMTTWWIAAVGVVCMLAGYYYTGGPLPIAYTPFGEITAGFFMGTVIIGLAYFIQTGTVTPLVLWISVPVASLVGAILLANNIRDLDNDKENGRKTVAILVGRTNAIRVLATMMGGAYVFTFILMFMYELPLTVLIIVLSVPKMIQAVKGFIGKSLPIEMMPAMKATAQTNTIFGLLLAIGLLFN